MESNVKRVTRKKIGIGVRLAHVPVELNAKMRGEIAKGKGKCQRSLVGNRKRKITQEPNAK